MTRFIVLFCFSLLTLTACPMSSSSALPRNMSLKAFDPHRQDFVCKHEADAMPPIDAQAEAWFQEGLRITSRDLWPDQRDYPKAVVLWQQAAERKHWKAMMNLAGVLIQGDGTEPYVVPPDTERAIRIVEEAMRLGIPAAFDAMGTYHRRAMGVNGDASRAYALWELAADMGSPSAQAFLGRALLAGYDNPKAGIWSNRPVGFKMLECAFAQGNGKAAHELALDYSVVDRDYGKAIRVWHEGVKFGSERSANSLATLFGGAEMTRGGPSPDPAREERYGALGDALYLNPDLRFPNLDKVLPLPPAKLPQWDMSQPQTLIDAAKQIVPAPKVQPTPGSQRTGRAHIPQGHALPRNPVVPASEFTERFDRLTAHVEPQRDPGTAPFSGYWLAQLTQNLRAFQVEWNERQVPLRYTQGEVFVSPDKRSLGEYAQVIGVRWHYLGQPVKLADPEPPIEAARGIARTSRIPMPFVTCRGNRPCPRTGIWEPHVDEGHALANVFDSLSRQAYVEKDQPFPDPRDSYLDIDPHELRWLWADNANQPAAAGMQIKQITLSDLHDEQGKPLA
ncbi:DUF6396 domain-containing protein [Variovorax sp. J22P168]|uniref:SEL1-like repeat protein n=1 Tax=Variovorax jilinensis TaxID=3053513 RepID=UPI0025756C1A|nr:DUF6396 domain-containing protein [Variovorax sp. J22P168]MDM0011038.1 DUF6396 domain-containing protein [Variovorax sp. J22P168]